MRKLIVVMFCTFGLVGVLFGTAFAQETGHYVNGVEGIKAATLPPPGFYYRLYNVFYNADDGEVNVLYRRKDGDYGLLQPELQ